MTARLDVSEEPEYLERNLRMTRSALYCSHNLKYEYPPHIHLSCSKDDPTNTHKLETALSSTICMAVQTKMVSQ